MADPAKKSSSSNYYRILGTNSNAGPELIKQRYLEKVRIFTPEKDPEEFKRIREAYETLKDPFERSKYDLETKYQGKANRLLQDVLGNIEHGNLNRANSLIDEAMDLAADNLCLLRVKAHIAINQGDLKEFEKVFAEIKAIAPDNEIGLILKNKVSMLLEEGYLEQARNVLEEIVASGIETKEELFKLYHKLYDEEDNFNKLWDLFVAKIKSIDNYTAEDMKYLTQWINCTIYYKEYDKEQYIIDLMSEYLEQIKENEEEKEMVFDVLVNEYEECRTMCIIEGQGVYAQLLLYLKDDPPYKEELQNMEEIVELNREIDRMAEDLNIYPFVFYQVVTWFVRWAFPGEKPEKYAEFPPPHMMSGYEEEHLDNVNTINVIRSEYPLIYKKYKHKLQQMYEHSYNSLSKRELKMFNNQLDTGSSSKYMRKKSGQIVKTKEVGRNDPCPCGSGKKYKKCCGR